MTTWHWRLISPILSSKLTLVKSRAQYFHVGPNASSVASDKQIREYAYSVLGVLDSKASALMRFDAVILTMLTLIYNNIWTRGVGELVPVLMAGVAFLTLASIFLCLFVVAVSWPFLGYAVPAGTTRPYGQRDELEELAKAMCFREASYMLSWTFCSLAMLLMVALAAAAVVERMTVGVPDTTQNRAGCESCGANKERSEPDGKEHSPPAARP
jgi:hypothetical protein